MFPSINVRSRNYLDTLVPLFAESVVIGVLVNLVSTYAEAWLVKNQMPLNGATLALLLFLLLAVLALYALFQVRARTIENYQPQKPTELGSMLSLVFFAQLLLLDCSQLLEFNRWALLGVGVTPFLIGTGMSGYLDDKYHEWKRKYVQQVQEEKAREEERRAHEEASVTTPEKGSEPPVNENPAAEKANRTPRFNMRAVLENDMDVEQQPGILFIIIESILSVKQTVTQLEIFEVCRALTRKLPPSTIFDLIRDLMESFVNIRGGNRKVQLNAEDPRNWKIIESNPYWKKNDAG